MLLIVFEKENSFFYLAGSYILKERFTMCLVQSMVPTIKYGYLNFTILVLVCILEQGNRMGV